MEQNNFFKIIPLATNAAYTPTLGWFVNKNVGKYLAAKLLNIFVGIRIMLLGLGILAFFI